VNGVFPGSRSGRRRESFDEVADQYDRYRVPPPREVVDVIVEAAGLGEGSRVLEIGCGAGQLSVSLAERGVDLVAVELGEHLAAHARRHLEPFPNARVEVGSFEEWPLPAERFDAVVCANAFHWLDPAIRFEKAAAALRPGGKLAILHVHHVRGGTPGFFTRTQECYVRWGMSDDPSFEQPGPDEVDAMYPELDALGEFGPVERHRLELATSYSTDSYVGHLTTDSMVNSVDAASRRAFLDAVRRLIDSEFDGAVARNFVYEVILASRQ
jgi:SAM-dependent methyltransferase